MRLIGLAVLGLTTVSLTGNSEALQNRARKWDKDKSVELHAVRDAAQLRHFSGNYHNDLQQSGIVDNVAVEEAELRRRKNSDQVHEASKWGYEKLSRLGRKRRDRNIHHISGDSPYLVNFDEDRDDGYEVDAGRRRTRRRHASLKSHLSDDGDEGLQDVHHAYELRDGTLYRVRDPQQDAARPRLRSIWKNSQRKPHKMLNFRKPRRIIDYPDDEYLGEGIAKTYPSNLGSNAGFFPRRNKIRRRNQFGAGNIGNSMYGATGAVKADDAGKWEDLHKPLVHSHKFGKLDYILS